MVISHILLANSELIIEISSVISTNKSVMSLSNPTVNVVVFPIVLGVTSMFPSTPCTLYETGLGGSNSHITLLIAEIASSKLSFLDISRQG